MASTPQNNLVAGPRLIMTAPKTGSVAVNQGDMIKTGSNLVLPLAAVSDVVEGISEETSPVTSLLDTLTQISYARPGSGVLVRLPLKVGDTLAYDDLVYVSSNVGTNPQEVSSSSAASAAKVGRCRELASVTQAVGGTARVLIEFLGAAA